MQRNLMNLSTIELEELVRSDDCVLIQHAVDELEHRSSRRARALAALGRGRLAAPEESRVELPFLTLPAECRDRPVVGLSGSVRLQNLLHRLEVRTLAGFEDTSWSAMAALSGMGRGTLATLIRAVGEAMSNEEGGAVWGGVTDLNELPISLEATTVLLSWDLETVEAFQPLSPGLTAATVRTGLVVTDALINGRVRWEGSLENPASGVSEAGGDARPMPPGFPKVDERLSGGPDASALIRFIQMFNRWQSLESAPLTLGRAIDGDREGLPPEIQALADACAASGILEDQDRSVPTAREEFEKWFRNLEHRDRQILLRRILPTHNQENLAAIGEDFGVSRERIRQLASRLEGRLLKAVVTGSGWRATRWKIHRLRHESWKFVPICDLNQSEGKLSTSADSAPLAEAFSGFLALASGMVAYGTDDWLEKESGELDQAAGDFNSWLQEAGWCTVEEARQEASRLGCHPCSVSAWLRAFTETKLVEDGLMYWPDGYEGRISSILERSGEALSVPDICEIYGSETSELSIRSALSRYDSFVKVSRSAWGLAKWGDRAFEGIAPAIKAKIEERGGDAVVAEISEEIAEECDVRAHSVALISQAPCFKVVEGKVMLRPQNEPYNPKGDLQTSRGLFLTRPAEASILLEVSREMLRGSGTALPEALGAHLGIRPGVRKGFHLENQKVTINWPETTISGPTLGSIRGCLRSRGFEPGDMIRLNLDAEDMDLSIERVDLQEAAVDRDAALRAATGLSGSGEALYKGVAHSLRCGRDAVRGILVRRGDSEIASLIPPGGDSPSLHQALGELGEAFPDSE